MLQQTKVKLKIRIKRKGEFSVLYLDLDNFKAYNDVYGFLKGDEITKKSWIVAIMLFVFITLLICYAVQFLTLNPNTPELAASQTALLQTSGITLVFILISFFIYLWIDDIEAKMGKRKSIDNSMDWFWRNV